LQATSHVEGDVIHKTLTIEQGAYFEGKSRRAEDPLSQSEDHDLAAKPDAVLERPAPRKGTTRFSRTFPESRPDSRKAN
jgi:cytoskeletal protein CcmA (bactofilin family)